jgi:large conductance mechanosensitive channel
MLKGFKDFLMRGNVVDLAVAVVIGATIYFLVVLPINKLAERRAKGVEPETRSPSEEVALLTEIRDCLQARS